jgi:hypothetical protein
LASRRLMGICGEFISTFHSEELGVVPPREIKDHLSADGHSAQNWVLKTWAGYPVLRFRYSVLGARHSVLGTRDWGLETGFWRILPGPQPLIHSPKPPAPSARITCDNMSLRDRNFQVRVRLHFRPVPLIGEHWPFIHNGPAD